MRQASLLRLYEPVLWRVLARADAIVATSAPYMRTSRFLRPFAGKTAVIPLGIDVTRFTSVDGAAVLALRRRLTPAGERLFLAVGRLRYYKGLDVALAAMPHVEGRLVVVGIVAPSFFNGGNLRDLIINNAPTLLVALGRHNIDLGKLPRGQQSAAGIRHAADAGQLGGG